MEKRLEDYKKEAELAAIIASMLREQADGREFVILNMAASLIFGKNARLIFERGFQPVKEDEEKVGF